MRLARVLPLIVFVIASLGALVAARVLSEPVSTDFVRYYEPRARELLAGSGLRDPNGDFYTRYPPGYPLILAGAFAAADALHLPEALLLTWLSAAAMACSTTLIYMTAALIFGRVRALLAAAAWALYPFALWTVSGGQVESMYMPFFFGAVYAFARCWLSPVSDRGTGENRNRWAILCGALIGVAMLIRPAGIGVGVILAVCLLFRRSYAGAVAILATNLAVVSLWIVPVALENGVLIPLSTGGAISVIDGVTFAARASDERESLAFPASVLALQTRIYDAVRVEPDMGAWFGIVIAQVRADPAAALHLYAIKAGRAWYATDSRRYETPIALFQIAFLGVIGVAIWRVVRQNAMGHLPTAARAWLIVVVALTIYGWIMTIGVLSILRYMVTTMGVLITLIPALSYSKNIRLSASSVAASMPAASRK
jgi:hypothetical protein